MTGGTEVVVARLRISMDPHSSIPRRKFPNMVVIYISRCMGAEFLWRLFLAQRQGWRPNLPHKLSRAGNVIFCQMAIGTRIGESFPDEDFPWDALSEEEELRR